MQQEPEKITKEEYMRLKQVEMQYLDLQKKQQTNQNSNTFTSSNEPLVRIVEQEITPINRDTVITTQEENSEHTLYKCGTCETKVTIHETHCNYCGSELLWEQQ